MVASFQLPPSSMAIVLFSTPSQYSDTWKWSTAIMPCVGHHLYYAILSYPPHSTPLLIQYIVLHRTPSYYRTTYSHHSIAKIFSLFTPYWRRNVLSDVGRVARRVALFLEYFQRERMDMDGYGWIGMDRWGGRSDCTGDTQG